MKIMWIPKAGWLFSVHSLKKLLCLALLSEETPVQLIWKKKIAFLGKFNLKVTFLH